MQDPLQQSAFTTHGDRPNPAFTMQHLCEAPHVTVPPPLGNRQQSWSPEHAFCTGAQHLYVASSQAKPSQQSLAQSCLRALHVPKPASFGGAGPKLHGTARKSKLPLVEEFSATKL